MRRRQVRTHTIVEAITRTSNPKLLDRISGDSPSLNRLDRVSRIDTVRQLHISAPAPAARFTIPSTSVETSLRQTCAKQRNEEQFHRSSSHLRLSRSCVVTLVAFPGGPHVSDGFLSSTRPPTLVLFSPLSRKPPRSIRIRLLQPPSNQDHGRK